MERIWLDNLPLLCKEASKFNVNVIIPVDSIYEDADGDVLISPRLDTTDPALHHRIWESYKENRTYKG